MFACSRGILHHPNPNLLNIPRPSFPNAKEIRDKKKSMYRKLVLDMYTPAQRSWPAVTFTPKHSGLPSAVASPSRRLEQRDR